MARKSFALHHGTLLVNVDMGDLSRYLKPSGLKLQSKNIASVRSRVVNLQDVNQNITIRSLRAAIPDALKAVYGVAVKEICLEADDPRFKVYEQKYRSNEWIFGQDPAFDCVVHDRFSWGEARLGITLQNGCIADVVLYTDSLDTELPDAVRKVLLNAEFTGETPCAAASRQRYTACCGFGGSVNALSE